MLPTAFGVRRRVAAFFFQPARKLRSQRRGLSLLELLLASTVAAMIAAALGALAMAVNTGSQMNREQGVALQHARVALERMRAACLAAHASAEFPGFVVVSEQIGTESFPDTLVVWRPEGTPSDPDGLPQFREVVIFTPDPSSPNRLLEVTAPNDARQVPTPSDQASWRSELEALLESDAAEQVQLTDALRTAPASATQRRAAVRFDVVLRPSDDDWTRYQNGELAWDELPWAQSIQGTQFGMRQAWRRVEMQLDAGQDAGDDSSDAAVLTFFGSAAIYYGMTR